jgi:dipeptidyl aminopeptidase/acylaminoacyl peptidase
MISRFPPLLIALATIIQAGDFPYQQPPKEIRDVLNASPTPAISVSPQRDYAVFLQAVRYPPIAQVAQPFLPLAGLRVDAATNGLHMASYYVSFEIKKLPGGEDIAIALPHEGKFSAPFWSPDGRQFAFTNTVAQGIELWIGSPATGQAHRVPGIRVNGVQVGGAAVQWLGDNKTLIVSTVRADRGSVPVEPVIPIGPHVRESSGNAGPAPTFEDLLATPHDEDLFDYYATSQLVYLDAASGKATPLGKPAIYTSVRPSPDQTLLLVGWLHKPYSYQLTARAFPEEIEVWDRHGKVEYKVASLPLADRVPLAGVRTGPRSYQWLPDKPAALVWSEALDGGDPKAKVPYRDRIVMAAALQRAANRSLQDRAALPELDRARRRQGAGEGLRTRQAHPAHLRGQSR